MGGEYQAILDALTQKKKEDFATNAYLKAAKSVEAMPEMGGEWAGGGGWASQLAQGIAKGAAIGGLQQTGLNEVETADDEQNRMLAEYADAIKGGDPEAQAAIEQSGMIPQVPAAVHLSQAMEKIDPTTGGSRSAPIDLPRARIIAKSIKGMSPDEAEQWAQDAAESGASSLEVRIAATNLNRQGYHDPKAISAEAFARRKGGEEGEQEGAEKYGGAPKFIRQEIDRANAKLQSNHVVREFEQIESFVKIANASLDLNSPIADEQAKRYWARAQHPATRVTVNDEHNFDKAQSFLNRIFGQAKKDGVQISSLDETMKQQIREALSVVEDSAREGYLDIIVKPMSMELVDQSPETLAFKEWPGLGEETSTIYKEIQDLSRRSKEFRGNSELQDKAKQKLKQHIEEAFGSATRATVILPDGTSVSDVPVSIAKRGPKYVQEYLLKNQGE